MLAIVGRVKSRCRTHATRSASAVSGEVPIVPPMAAVANAIADATGKRLRDLPMSPPKVLAALDDESRSRYASRRSSGPVPSYFATITSDALITAEALINGCFGTIPLKKSD
jgi:hypothetical protein